MIVGRCTGPGGRKLMILGLDSKNVELLEDGKPIFMDLDELGFPKFDIFVVFSPTLEGVIKELRTKFNFEFNQETEIFDHRKTET